MFFQKVFKDLREITDCMLRIDVTNLNPFYFESKE